MRQQYSDLSESGAPVIPGKQKLHFKVPDTGGSHAFFQLCMLSVPTAGLALGGRLCVLRQREVSRGRGWRGTGGLQLNREASSISRWGDSATLSSIYTSTTLTQQLTRPGGTGSSGLSEGLSSLEQPRDVRCQPGQHLIDTDLASKAVGDTGRSPNSWLGWPA